MEPTVLTEALELAELADPLELAELADPLERAELTETLERTELTEALELVTAETFFARAWVGAGSACEVAVGPGSACEPINQVRGSVVQKETVFGGADSCTALASAWVGVGSACEVVVGARGAFPRRRNSSFAIASSPATAAPGGQSDTAALNSLRASPLSLAASCSSPR